MTNREAVDMAMLTLEAIETHAYCDEWPLSDWEYMEKQLYDLGGHITDKISDIKSGHRKAKPEGL